MAAPLTILTMKTRTWGEVLVVRPAGVVHFLHRAGDLVPEHQKACQAATLELHRAVVQQVFLERLERVGEDLLELAEVAFDWEEAPVEVSA